MANPARARLLKALDLEVWIPRDAPRRALAPADPAAPAPIETAAVAPTPAAAGRARVEPPPRRASPPAAAGVDLLLPTPDDAPAYVAPADWAGLADAVRGCTRCKLARTRTNTVFGVGPDDAPLLVVGEGPGAEEDQRGEPFVGRAGQLLDEMLASIGRDRRRNVYIANVVKCRPPANRDPEADEVAACRPFLDRQIELLAPKRILALGRIAAQRLLGSTAPLSRLREAVHPLGPAQTPVHVSYHPAYLLRTPTDKAKSWLDLKRVHQALATEPASSAAAATSTRPDDGR